jgi:hypothetical protein
MPTERHKDASCQLDYLKIWKIFYFYENTIDSETRRNCRKFSFEDELEETYGAGT